MAQNGRKGGGGRKKAASPPKKNILTFDYIKSNYYRVVQINGVYGGLSPSGDIHMAVWSQRRPYPQRIVQEYDPENATTGKELSRVIRDADIIREIEVGLVFTPELARIMIDWLEAKLKDVEKMEKALGELPEPGETE